MGRSKNIKVLNVSYPNVSYVNELPTYVTTHECNKCFYLIILSAIKNDKFSRVFFNKNLVFS